MCAVFSHGAYFLEKNESTSHLPRVILSANEWLRVAFEPRISLRPLLVLLAERQMKSELNEALWVNVLQNGDANQLFAFWEEVRGRGDGWQVEAIAGACDRVAGSHNFVTSYEWCSKVQLIDLVAMGFSEEYLAKGPALRVEDWISARSDCESVYKASVQLLDAESSVLGQWEIEERDAPIEPHWVYPWEPVRIDIPSLPPNARFVRFEHSGKDKKWWAGHYGCKMTDTTCEVLWDPALSEGIELLPHLLAYRLLKAQLSGSFIPEAIGSFGRWFACDCFAYVLAQAGSIDKQAYQGELDAMKMYAAGMQGEDVRVNRQEAARAALASLCFTPSNGWRSVWKGSLDLFRLEIVRSSGEAAAIAALWLVVSMMKQWTGKGTAKARAFREGAGDWLLARIRYLIDVWDCCGERAPALLWDGCCPIEAPPEAMIPTGS